MKDYIVRATAANAQIRAFACSTREMVEHARSAHNTSPVVTAALGRLMTAGAMMGSMMKGDKDVLTLQIHGGGPVKGLTVTADSHGNVKGYALVPDAMVPANAQGKLDVGGVIGLGFMNVIKDLGLKEPYVGQTVLQTGEIGDDLTYYFVTSEQIPSSVGLGVLMEKDNTVRQAGGFIIQLMPFAEESVIAKLEENLSHIASVTSMLDAGNDPKQMLQLVLEGFDIEFTDELDTKFYCDCCKEKVSKALIAVGKKELKDMIADGKDIEVNCHFCSTRYNFTVEELEELYKRAVR